MPRSPSAPPAGARPVPSTPAPRLLDYRAAEQYSGIPRRTLRELWAKRAIPGALIGRRLMFPRDGLDRFIDTQLTPAAEQSAGSRR